MINKEIEEAKERLKYINMAYDCCNYYSRYDLDCIETLLQYIDQLENKVKELEKENDKLTYARNWYFEITVNKLVTPEMLNKILRTKYIGRDEIKNKIEGLKNKLNEIHKKYGVSDYDFIRCEAQMQCLQELLEEK